MCRSLRSPVPESAPDPQLIQHQHSATSTPTNLNTNQDQHNNNSNNISTPNTGGSPDPSHRQHSSLSTSSSSSSSSDDSLTASNNAINSGNLKANDSFSEQGILSTTGYPVDSDFNATQILSQSPLFRKKFPPGADEEKQKEKLLGKQDLASATSLSTRWVIIFFLTILRICHFWYGSKAESISDWYSSPKVFYVNYLSFVTLLQPSQFWRNGGGMSYFDAL